MRTVALFLTASLALPAAALADTERPLPSIVNTTPWAPAGVDQGASAVSPGSGIAYTWDRDGDGDFDDTVAYPWGHGGDQPLKLDTGVHTFAVKATDRFGRVGIERRTYTVHGSHLPPSIGFGPFEEHDAWQPFVVPIPGTSNWTSIASKEADLDGDGVFEADARRKPIADFTVGGGHVIHARITDDNGLTSTASRTFNIVGTGQTASFTVAPAGPLLAGELVTLAATPVEAGPGHYEYDLDGDGSYESDQGSATSLFHTFAAGTHTIGLRVTDAGGTVATSRIGIDVEAAGGAPWISLTAPGGAVVGRKVQLESVSGGGDRTVEWDADGDGAFDDGDVTLPADAPGSSVSFAYDTPGVHEIRARVTAGGVSRVATRTIDVAATAQPVPPVLGDFEFPWGQVIRQGRTTRFGIESAASPSFDLDGDGQFDDVPARDGDAYVWRFTAPVTVAAKVTGANGLTAISTASVTPVAGVGIQADIDFVPPRAGHSSHATAAVRGDTADCCTAAWDLDGDGAYDDAAGFDATFTPAAGEHEIGVRVDDEDGATTTTRRTFTVGGAPPEITFAADDDLLTATAVDPDGEAITALEWDLDGDGEFDDATGATVPRPASGRVELKATDATGDIGVASFVVPERDTVGVEPPVSPEDDAPPAAPAPLHVTASVGQVTLSRLLSRGLPVTVRCETACRTTATLAQRGTTKLGSATGASRLTVKLSAKARKALRTTRAVKLQVSIRATSADGRIGSAARTFTVRR